jgi:hypothetical protein
MATGDMTLFPIKGNSYEDFAKSAYKAYAANTGNKNFQGNPMPEWEQLPAAIQTAWEASARQIIDSWEGKANGWESFPDENKWKGWTRPRDRMPHENTN